MSLSVNTARLRWGQLFRLSWHDLWHERSLALCTACVLAATLAPLWTLWGLERGVIGAMIERQDRDPLMRKLEPESSGSRRFDAAFFARVRAWPEVAFVVPTVRSTSALVELFADAGSSITSLQATAAGDPLLAGFAPPVGRDLLLGAEVARKLKVSAGQRLRIALNRKRNGVDEPLGLTVRVGGVLPANMSETDMALSAGPLLEEIEAWRDGRTVAAFGPDGNGPPEVREVYPLFRMHAASIRDVQALHDRLEAEGVSTRTQAAELERTLGMQRNLRTVLALVGTSAATGAVVALAALQMATLRRKRREFALLKLTGHGRPWLVAMPCAHALAMALLGGAIAFCVYLAGATAINLHFADHLGTSERAVRLGAQDIAAGLLAAVLISMLPALWGGWRASNVEAADELRDN